MANNSTQTYREFRKSAQARLQAANAVLNKQASFEATDPTCRGTVAIPDCGDGSNREKLNLPQNMTNYSEPDKMHNLLNVTRPNGTGQGEYITPRNGTARDEAIHSFTAPMDKLADAATALRNSAAAVRKQAQATTEAQDMQMTLADVSEGDILAKLAGIGAIALQHEEGRRTMQYLLEKEAGIKEAQNIISQTQDMMNNYAYAQQYEEDMQMQKLAAQSLSHQALLESLETDFEKQAYAQGAVDGEQAAQAMEAGQSPDTADVGGITEDDIVEALQELVQSGQIDEQDLQALLGGVEQAGEDGDVSNEEIAAILQQAVQNGEIEPEEAQVVAQAILEGQAGDAEDAAGPEDEVAKAAAYYIDKTASVINQVAGMA